MNKLTHFRPDDVLTDVLRSIRIQGTLYCRSRMSAPWGFRVPGRESATFHIVTGGACWLTIDGVAEETRLRAGDIVILPHGHAHCMRNPSTAPVSRMEDLDRFVAKLVPDGRGVLRNGRGGAVTTLICGGFQIDGHLTNPLLSALPPLILVRSEDSQLAPWLQATVQWVEMEAESNPAGAETVIARLSEILFIQAMRVYTSMNNNESIGWLKALNDPYIGPALALIHDQPQKQWTLALLAEKVGLSRTAFTSRFRELVDQTPLKYITHWRLNKAAAYLRTGTGKLAVIASLVGYDSEVTLSKAFKRHFGVAPGAYRRTIPMPFEGE